MSGQLIRGVADGELLGEVETIAVSEVPAVVARARGALAGWRRRAPHERADPLRRACELMLADAESIARLHARESGKVIAQARFEVRGAVRLMEANAELGRMRAGDIAPTGALPGGERDLTIVERVPLGVVVTVIPFNFPIELMVEKAAAALAVGNVVIVKAPPQNPLAAGRVVALMHEAGIPEDVLQIVSADTPASAALCAADGVDAVSLTGSVGAGVGVATATAAQLRPLHLELGGNGAAIVLPDADLDFVVSESLRGRLLMNGQACAATKRLVVHRDVADEVTARLDAALAPLAPTDPLDESARLGPLIDERSAARVSGQVDRAVASGARRVRGTANDGAWFAPTLLADVPTSAAVAVDDEIFGPVFTVVPVSSADEALAVANASSLRLTAAVFSADIPRAMSLAAELDFGGVVVNGTNNYRPPVVPFGGVSLAGAGREGIGYTIDELTRSRFIAVRNLRPTWDAQAED
ncbi:aldehyde dehydrogenase family protein [Microbacterium sp. SSW1-59]|uniref:aldehyde dehydrogenase family protein n=1 Tax=Microbacterium xanthum TaxID=3079794 RepID=UPI002AD47BB4|nr:aldehyde dehydrogenase family protein [Microbacterium sp. SSW1-59]MDZ8200911.1 aldehyde dehydrogenase family protein [Microbacterium sp. SSW1-59]